MESHGKPGIVREISTIFIQSREKSEKTNCLIHKSFSLTCVWLFAKWLFHLVSVKVNSVKSTLSFFIRTSKIEAQAGCS